MWFRKKTVTRPLAAGELGELREFSSAGRRLLEAEDASLTSEEVVAQAGDYVTRLQRLPDQLRIITANEEALIDVSWGIGAAIGQEFGRQFGWEWRLIGASPEERFGLVSHRNTLVFYPSFFVRECLLNPMRDFTGLLMFNMVTAGRFGDVPANSYLDLSEQVVRIVPRSL